MGRVKSMLHQLAWGAVIALALSAPAFAMNQLTVTIDEKDGSYSIAADGIAGAVLRASPAIHVNGKWIHARDYSSCRATHAVVTGELGDAEQWSLHYSGLKDAPDLLLRIRSYRQRPFGELQVSATNTTSAPIHVESLRLIDAVGTQLMQLGADAQSARVLSDSFSEDRPGMALHDLGEPENQVHRAVGSQLIYNQRSKKSWFIGALTSDKFLSVLRLHMAQAHGAETHDYEVDSTGTTELLKENSLQESSAEDRIELSVPVAPGAMLSSERMLFSVSSDYHDQLETYGRLIRDLHHARVSAATPLGWWSWTAYYFGLNQGTALNNAQWLAQHLKQFGYTFLHMDEGYQYARGEYATPDAVLFPDGVGVLERRVVAEGLTPGIWTAPFEVSERSWVFEHHPEWLVHNAKGNPIHIGLVAEGKDHLYALDPTHPDAQAYLRKTYSTLVNDWGIRYIKMDFMEDSAVEGYYHVPNTTALEAQRIGIQTVREAVGEQVLLDKDGSELLNPVGLVDMGRISQDTGHTFQSSKEAAPGIAARYYMNRNYFVADPDAFSVSRQTVDDQSWHNDAHPLTLDEARVSIALSAVSGGMFEIGDDLSTLGEDADRLALVENRDLLDIAVLGRASRPLDLMSYAAADLQPSMFLLHEDARVSILTIFNWTESPRTHTMTREELNLDAHGRYAVSDILAHVETKDMGPSIQITQPAHSVQMIRIVDTEREASGPAATLLIAKTGSAGETLKFSAKSTNDENPLLRVTWDFGDGVSTQALSAEHAYTHAGTFTVVAHETGVGGVTKDESSKMIVTGAVVTKFFPEKKRRLTGAADGNKSNE